MLAIHDFFIYEASQYAPKNLVKISKCFSKLKKNVRDKEARAEMKKLLQEFTKVKDIKFSTCDMYNAMTLPIYNKYMFDGIVDAVKISLSSKLDPINHKKLQQVKSVVEPSEGIKTIYLWFGTPLIKDLSANELTAILLHELGHIYYMHSIIPRFIEFYLKKICGFATIAGVYLTVSSIIRQEFFTLLSKTLYLIFLINLIFVHGIGFHERIEEYRSDNFALKYGYGDDLARAFVKFSQMREELTPTESLPFLLKWIKKFILAIHFVLFSSTHPSDKNRIESLENQIFSDYKKMYPKYKSVIDEVEGEIKQEANKKKK